MSKLTDYYIKHTKFCMISILVLCVLFATCRIFFVFPGEFLTGDDIHFHLNRIQGIVDGIKGGQFPVKIYPNLICGGGVR